MAVEQSLASPRVLLANRKGHARSLIGDVWLRLSASTTGRAGMALTLLLLLMATVIPVSMPYDPATDRDLRNRLVAPTWQLSEVELTKRGLTRSTFLFGTDELGRDIFTRVLHGAPLSLGVGLLAVLSAVLFGSLLGLAAGYIGGWFDIIAVWVMDILLALPSILLAIAISGVSSGPDSLTARLGNLITTIPGVGRFFDLQLFTAMVAIAIIEIPVFGRIARAAVLSARHQEYVVAAHALGLNGRRTLFRHILPNCLAPLLVQASLSVATAILSIAALGFLGLGARPPRPEWGTMLSTARDYIGEGRWWCATFPGLAIMITVLGFNLLGDGLRDAFDPRLRR